MQNASCTRVNGVCHLLEGEVIDAAMSICHLITPPSTALLELTAQRPKFSKNEKYNQSNFIFCVFIPILLKLLLTFWLIYTEEIRPTIGGHYFHGPL